MNILAFDTATNACSVALQVGATVFSRHEIAPSQHATLLLPMIQAVLDDAKITATELNAIAFGCGPGSFMGVRLATATAQGLAFGIAIPVVPISTLQTLAQTVFQGSGIGDRKSAGQVAAGWDARMHEIYWGLYTPDKNGIMQVLQPDALCAPDAIDTALFSRVGCVFAGNAWVTYEKQFPPSLFFGDAEKQTDLYPDAKAMLVIAISRYLKKEFVSAENAHPHYLRHHVVHNHK